MAYKNGIISCNEALRLYKDNVNTHINKKAARCCQIRQSEGMPKLSTPFPGDKFRNKCYRLNCFRISASMVIFCILYSIAKANIIFLNEYLITEPKNIA